MTARFSLILGKTRGHRPRLQLPEHVLSLVLTIYFTGSAVVQPNTGSVTGIITASSSGARLEAVNVLLSETAGAQILRSKTDEAGQFSFVGLPPGDYNLRASITGLPEYLVHLSVRA